MKISLKKIVLLLLTFSVIFIGVDLYNSNKRQAKSLGLYTFAIFFKEGTDASLSFRSWNIQQIIKSFNTSSNKRFKGQLVSENSDGDCDRWFDIDVYLCDTKGSSKQNDGCYVVLESGTQFSKNTPCYIIKRDKRDGPRLRIKYFPGFYEEYDLGKKVATVSVVNCP